MSESGTSIAVISSHGGVISQLLLGDFEIVPKFSLDDPLDFVYGHTLAPWPNRLEDGEYSFAGTTYRFDDLDAQRNKNHGLVLDRNFEVRAHESDHAVLGYRFGLDAGYPFEIDLEITYLLTEDGLEVTATALNMSDDAPFAIGFHPYLLTGENFRVEAGFTHQSIQNERMLPTGMREIQTLQLTQASPELQTLDHCFQGASELVISRPDGEIVVETLENLPYFMLYRPGQRLSEAGGLLAVEPQSSMANVFRDDPESCLLPSGKKRSYRFAIRKR